MPNGFGLNLLDITFTRKMTSVTLTFATADFHKDPPTDIRITGYVGSVGTPAVGSATGHGAYLGDTMPMGTLNFNSPQPFNLIEISIPPGQFQATTVFLVDNIIVTPDYTLPLYTLTYSAGPNGLISGPTPQTIGQGCDGSPVTAVANTGYHFTNWSDGVLTASRTDTNVTTNVTVTAYFAVNPQLGLTVLPNTWAVGPLPLSAIVESTTFSATNTGNVAEDFMIQASDGVGGWHLATVAGLNAFRVDADKNNDGVYELVLTKADQALTTGVLVGGPRAFRLKYGAPTGDTVGGAVAQNFSVILKASLHVP